METYLFYMYLTLLTDLIGILVKMGGNLPILYVLDTFNRFDRDSRKKEWKVAYTV